MTQITSKLTPVVVAENGGQTISAFGETARFKLTSEHTGGAFTLLMEETPPGGGPPLHYHENEDEIFIVQEGRVQFTVEDRTFELGPGGVVFAPRGSVHKFYNPTDKTIRQWILLTPCGFENFFANCAAEFNKPTPPDMSRITEISAQHGIRFVQR